MDGSPCPALCLDCQGKYAPKGAGDRMFNQPLIAETLYKTVTVQVTDDHMFANICTVTRLDLLK